MRVVFVLPKAATPGGAERYVSNLVTELAGDGVACSLVGFSGAGSAQELESFVRIPCLDADSPLALKALFRRLRPDIVHWNMPSPFCFGRGAAFLLGHGLPQVSTDHLPLIPGGRRWVAERRVATQFLDALVCVSRADVEPAQARWRAKWTVGVPNGVPEQERQGRHGAGPPRFLFLGRLANQKNPLLALETFKEVRARIPAARLTIAGDGPLRAAVADYVAMNEMTLSVDILGHVSTPHAILADSDILLAPSRFEGLPLVYLEALMVGTAVLTSDLPAARELSLSTGCVVTVGSLDPRVWAERAIHLLNSRPAMPSIPTAFRESISAARMARDTRAVYERVLASKLTKC